MKKIKAVTFDFWETLFGFLSPQELEEVRRIRVEAFSRILKLPPQEVEQAFYQVVTEMNQEREASGLEVPLDEVIRRTVVRLGKEGAPLDLLEDVYVKAVFERLPGPMPGAMEVLEKLREKDTKLAIISNTIHGQIERALLRHYQVHDKFKVLLFSSEVRYRKPRPEIFRMALYHMGVRPQETLHVGDTPGADVLGALKVGMGAVHYDPEGKGYPPELPKPHHSVSHLLQVLDLVEN